MHQAENDPTAPMPLLVNLSSFPFAKENSPESGLWRLGNPSRPTAKGRQLEDWLVEEWSKFPGVSRPLARKWLEEGRVAALLDGLDEVFDTRRADLVRLLNATFLRQYPDAPVVVCSRIYEYQPLQECADTKLQVPGAVTLQPLTDKQIEEYLKQADAGSLHEALQADKEIAKLAQTPLMLSMMTLAYAGVPADEIASDASFSQRRHQLMETYVDRMLQRHERRRRGLPCYNLPGDDVPTERYRYHPRKVNRYLGWLAVRLSTRMRTSCSVDALFELLRHDLDPAQQRLDLWLTNLALAVWLVLALVVLALALMPLTFVGVAQSFAVLLCAGALLVILKSTHEVRPWAGSGDPSAYSTSLLIGLAVVIVGAVSQTLSAVLPLGFAPFPMGVIAITGLIAMVGLWSLVLISFPARTHPPMTRPVLPWTRLVLLSGVALTVGVLLPRWVDVPWPPGYFLGGMLVVSQAVWGSSLPEDDVKWWKRLLYTVAFISAVSAALGLGAFVVGEVNRWEVLAIVASVMLVIAFYWEDASVPVVGLILSAVVGALFADAHGAVLGAALFGLLTFACVLAEGEAQWKGWSKLMWSPRVPIRQILDRWVFSPVLRCSIALSRFLPFRFRRFHRYCRESLLVRNSPRELEFVHRMLRDYFAVQELLPQLRTSDKQQRLAAIRALGYQGVSATGTLADLAADGEMYQRVAAITSLSRIASPETVGPLELAANDKDPNIRRTAILSLGNVEHSVRHRICRTREHDDEPVVQFALAEATGYDYSVNLRVLEQARKTGVAKLAALLREDADPRFRQRSARALVELANPDALDALLLALRDTDLEVRRTAAVGLGKFGDNRVVAALISALQDPHALVRRAAAEALGRLGDMRAVTPLIAALQDPDAEVRRITAGVAGDLGDKRVVDSLISALQDADPKARRIAVQSLGKLGDLRAVPPLIRVLQDGDSDAFMRWWAAESLGKLGDARAVEPLLDALTNDESILRRSAAEALGRLKNLRAIEPLIGLLRDSDRLVCWRAAQALGELGDARAIEPLERVVQDTRDAELASMVEVELRKLELNRHQC